MCSFTPKCDGVHHDSLTVARAFDIFQGAASRQVMLALHCTSDFIRAEGLGNDLMRGDEERCASFRRADDKSDVRVKGVTRHKQEKLADKRKGDILIRKRCLVNAVDLYHISWFFITAVNVLYPPRSVLFSSPALFIVSYALVGTMCHATNIIVIMQFGLEADWENNWTQPQQCDRLMI